MPTANKTREPHGVSMIVTISQADIRLLGGWESDQCIKEVDGCLEYARLLLQEQVEEDYGVSLSGGCFYESPFWAGLEPLGIQGRSKTLAWCTGEPGGRVPGWKIPTTALLHTLGKSIAIETEEAYP